MIWLLWLACTGTPEVPPPPAPIDIHEPPAKPADPLDTLDLAGCSSNPSGWCPSPPDDPCGVHQDKASCQADPLCEGWKYNGESVVACTSDDRCFSDNCPTVGCLSRCETLERAACSADPRCLWKGESCVRFVSCGPKASGG